MAALILCLRSRTVGYQLVYPFLLICASSPPLWPFDIIEVGYGGRGRRGGRGAVIFFPVGMGAFVFLPCYIHRLWELHTCSTWYLGFYISLWQQEQDIFLLLLLLLLCVIFIRLRSNIEELVGHCASRGLIGVEVAEVERVYTDTELTILDFWKLVEVM